MATSNDGVVDAVGQGERIWRERTESGEEQLWKDEAVLESLYWDDELSLKQVADKFGDDVSWHNIRYWMEKHDIPRRDAAEATPGNPNIHEHAPDHPASFTEPYERAEEILGTDPRELSQSEVAEGFFEHEELVIRFEGCGHDAYYIVNTDDPTLYRGTTAPTTVDLESGYVQSLFDQYDGVLVHESATENLGSQ